MADANPYPSAVAYHVNCRLMFEETGTQDIPIVATVSATFLLNVHFGDYKAHKLITPTFLGKHRSKAYNTTT